jgi:acid stress-induced BolA-like protein IbaG/YrbA
MNPEEIKSLITSFIDSSTAEVNSDDNVHFEATIISESFENKSLIERHKMVYASLGNKMDQEIHALTITALTPDENKKLKF